VTPIIQYLNLVVQFPDVSPDDLNRLDDMLDETPSYDVERREWLTDLIARLTRMLLTAKAGQ
jgi:hypothetical protein